MTVSVWHCVFWAFYDPKRRGTLTGPIADHGSVAIQSAWRGWPHANVHLHPNVRRDFCDGGCVWHAATAAANEQPDKVQQTDTWVILRDKVRVVKIHNETHFDGWPAAIDFVRILFQHGILAQAFIMAPIRSMLTAVKLRPARKFMDVHFTVGGSRHATLKMIFPSVIVCMTGSFTSYRWMGHRPMWNCIRSWS